MIIQTLDKSSEATFTTIEKKAEAWREISKWDA